jgi:FtsP/CotA-like multicopper oxidase with cupredoxin domain
MNRRQILKQGALATATAALATEMLAPAASAATITFDLTIEPVDVEMIDGTIVYQLLYYGGPLGPDSARPRLTVTEGDTVNIRVRNNAPEAHGFAVPGIPAATITSIPPGAQGTCRFTAPTGGLFMYVDPINDPVFRLVGLHGALVVRPRNGTTPGGAPTPYSRTTQTQQIRQLFNQLGPAGRFPGARWNPNSAARDIVWMFCQTDPRLNARVAAGEKYDFVPRYFTINGLSGFDIHHDAATIPRGYVGQPTLIRVMNAGLAFHSPHIHGNHVIELTHANPDGTVRILSNLYEIDVWQMPPMQRTDVLLPFEKPPDIVVWPPVEEPFPLRYPMHCHNEISQTAGGGNYPQGLVAHWELLGPYTPPNA